jgi:phosphatidylglycerol:prolipoprotein diacylglycerol transferase
MLPLVYRFTFSNPVELGALCTVLIAYIAWSGWRGAPEVKDEKTGKLREPTNDERRTRAILYALGGVGLSGALAWYTLPEVPFFGKGRGEGIPIHTYGILVGSGFVAAATAAAWMIEKEWPGAQGILRRNQLLDLAFYLFISAMVGSRVLFILVNWKQYAAHPGDIFSLGGGLVFYGGLIGASLTGYWYAQKNGIEFLRLADAAIPTVSLGSALGRLGCFAAGCCWGDVAAPSMRFGVNFPGAGTVKTLFGGAGDTPSLAWQSMSESTQWVNPATGDVFDMPMEGAVRVADWVREHGHTLPVHPTQLYDSFGQLLLFAGMITLRRYKRFHGQIFGMWLMSYAVLRSTVEVFRGDAERGTLHKLLLETGFPTLAQKVPLNAWYDVSTSQVISFTLFALGAWVVARGVRALAAAPKLDLQALAA